MTHLTPDELLDAVEGLLNADRAAHLSGCPECRRQHHDLSRTLAEAKEVSVPEPSPLYWNQLSVRVRAAVDAEPAAGGWASWLRWQVLLPLGSAAVIMAALMFSLNTHRDVAAPPDTLVAFDAPVTADVLDGADALDLLAGAFDIDAAADAGVIEPGVADQAVLELTAEEQAELTRLLQAEMTRSKS